jgi:hypothetical protein
VELEYKSDLDQALQRMAAFWYGEILDRPLINVTAPNGRKPRQIEPPETMEEKVLDFEHRLEIEEEDIRCTYFGGEALPTVWPDFGPSYTAACLGGELQISDVDPHLPTQGSVWCEPVIRDWEGDFGRIGFDPENLWYKRGIEFVKLAREKGRGKFFQAILDVDGGGDTCADLRGSSELAVDLYDNREWVIRLLETVRKANAEIVKRICDEVAKDQGGCVNTGWRIWAPGRSYNMRNDFAYLVSPRMFREVFLDAMIKESETTLDFTVFHCHTEDYDRNRSGRQAWLDVVLSIPKIQGVQWPYAPSAVEDYRRIIDAGKFVVSCVERSRIREMIRALGPKYMKRIWIITQASDPEDAKAIIRILKTQQP